MDSEQSKTIGQDAAGFQIIPLKSLVESKTNPRGQFDTEQLRELTASVKSHGVLQAILVRRVGDNGTGDDPRFVSF